MSDQEQVTALTPDDLARIEELAEKQARAFAQMLVYDEGVGGLGIRHPEMFEDMLAWAESTENEHADTTLALVAGYRSLQARITELETGQYALAAKIAEAAEEPHADTCAMELSPDAGYACSCFRAVLDSDALALLAMVKREAKAEALEQAAEDLDVHFQDLPSWTDSYKAGERSDDWMKGSTRMVGDAIKRLRARAVEYRVEKGHNE